MTATNNDLKVLKHYKSLKFIVEDKIRNGEDIGDFQYGSLINDINHLEKKIETELSH